ncbi:MAG: LuxR C-terminal-related transcriptional regulator [Halanaerobiales bacterium]|nr:LuxR C-terminal-related transcriptional regulator [Halanaerobiales bacterium]
MDINKWDFDYKEIKKEVTTSWSRCIKYKTKRVVNNNSYKQNNESAYLDEQAGLLNYCNNYFSEIIDKIDQKVCFFLVNENLNLLEIIVEPNIENILEKYKIKRGFSFIEKEAGTNAVYLAQKTRKPISILPGHHYCKPFNSFYSIAFPLMIKENILGYINIISRNIIKKEVICLCKIFQDNLKLKIDYKLLNKNNKFNNLTEKQLYLIKNMANGYTEKVIANELHLSISTIKYHKRKLFNIFHASSKLEIVIKAFKNGLLSFEEVEF